MKNANAEQSVRDFLIGLSAERKMYFVGTTLKSPVSYRCGEKITFKIRLEYDGKPVNIPYVHYFAEGDDGSRNEGYVSAFDDGWFYIDTTLNRDGFVHVIAEACDENKCIIEDADRFEGGAGADVDKIKCETDIPEDYLEFWDKLKQEAFAIPKEIIFEEQFETEPGFVAYDMRYKTTAGDFLSLTYTYPDNAQPGTLKLLSIYMGYGIADATPVCRDGYLVIRINTHDIYNRQPQQYYDEIGKGKFFRYGLNREENKLPETTYWKKMFIRDMQAFNYFKNHPLVNGTDYEFEGGSQAAFRACNMAAHTKAATMVGLNVPWFCDIFAIQKQKRINIAWRPMEDNGLRYFDTAVAAKYLECPVYIEAGLGDYICPPSGQMAMYNGIKAPKKMVFIQNRTHSYTPQVMENTELCDGYQFNDWSFFK